MLTASLVRMTKGAAASIILLLLAEPAGGNQEWIERYTGYTDKPISQALGFLMEIGIIGQAGERGAFRYFLANQEKQLPLPVDASLIFFNQIESESFRLDPLEESGSSGSPDLDSSRNLPLPDSGARESEKFRLDASSPCRGLERLLDRHEVRNPARGRILAARFDADFVQAHLVQAENVGLAIWRIEHNWPIDAAKWREWRGSHCQDCEQYRHQCVCEPDEDDPDEDDQEFEE